MPPRSRPQVATINGNSYVCRSIQLVSVDDWPQPVPTSGRQTAASRWPIQTTTLGDIRNAFGGLVHLLSDEENEHFAHGHLHELYDSESETRYGRITNPRKHNTVTFPAHTGDGNVAGDTANDYNRNPHAAVYYAGTVNTGVFTWLTDDGNAGDVFAITWTGTAWADAFIIISSGAVEMGFDVAVHKGELLYLYSAATAPVVAYSTTGSTLGGTYANAPAGAISPVMGSRLLDDGNTLYAFLQLVTGTFNLYKTTDKGGTAWTTLFSAWPGFIRDVGHFYDKSGTYSVVVLTNDRLYKLNTTTSLLEELYAFPFAGRAMQVVGDWLHVYLDAGRVWRIRSDWDAIEDISPGGQQRMPSTKAFDNDTNGQVCVTGGISGPYVMWGGDLVGGSDEAILLLQWVESLEGWHYIGKVADANNPNPLRFIFLDPTSGDLIGAYNTTDANTDLSTGFQFKDIEVDPLLMATPDYETAGFVTSQRTSFGAASVPTTLFRVYITSDDVDATETVTPKYGLEGDSETTTSLTAITTDNGNSTFGSGNGISATTAQLHLALASGSAILSPKLIDVTVEYMKIPDVRWVYLFEIDLEKTAQSRVQTGAAAVMTEIKTTIQGSKVKLAASYGSSGTLALLPFPKSRIDELLHGAPQQDVSGGTYTLAMVEV